MNEQAPGQAPHGRAAVSEAIVSRERGRVRLRAVTVTAGVAGLVTAGVVAFTLPGPAHSGSNSTPGGTSASTGSGTDGESSSDDGQSSVTAPTTGGSGAASAGSGGVSHATSGGS